MTKSVYTAKYQRFIETLTQARKDARLTQAELASHLKRPQSFVSKYERSERRLDVAEFLEIASALGIDPGSTLAASTTGKGRNSGQKTIFETWGVSPEELSQHAYENPSLNGLLMGYVAEIQLRKLLDSNKHVTDSSKADDHDRKNKGDRTVVYRGHRVVLESKSLQSNHVKQEDDGNWLGMTQVDASDTTDVKLPDGSKVRTVCLPYGTFDVLAVNCFLFGNQWRWQFCRNADLPNSRGRNYSDYQKRSLMATMHKVAWPVQPPFHEDLWELLDEMIKSGELPNT